MSNMTPPPSPVTLRGEVLHAVRWSPYKKQVRADLAATRARGLSGPVEVVPVRTFLQRGYALIRDPARTPHDPVSVDLRPGRAATAPVCKFDRDGQI